MHAHAIPSCHPTRPQVKAGAPLSSLPGLDSGILFCTYDLLVAGSRAAKKAAADSKKAKEAKAAVKCVHSQRHISV